MTDMGAYFLAGILLLLAAVLTAPLRYSVALNRKGLAVEVSVLFGLLRKKKSFPGKKEKGKDRPPEKKSSPGGMKKTHGPDGKAGENRHRAEAPENEQASSPRERETEKTAPAPKKEEPAEKGPERKDPVPEKEEKTSEEARQELNRILDEYDRFLDEERKDGNLPEPEEKEERKRPSLRAQLRFALRNGFAEKAMGTVSALIRHSFPGHWEVTGEFGTSDPMTTGILCGMTRAFFVKETKDVIWRYTESVMDLTISGRGRIIPLYAAYQLLRLILSRQAREFYHFRKGREGKWTKN